MTKRIGRREAVWAIMSLPALTAGFGCEASSKTKTKAFKVVKKIAKRLSKYNPVGMVAELVELALEIRAVINGTDEVVGAIALTPEEADSLRNGGELEIEDGDGKKHAVKLKGK